MGLGVATSLAGCGRGGDDGAGTTTTGDGGGGDGSDGGTTAPEGDLVGPDGQVELTLVYTEGAEFTQTTAEFIGQELADIGIAVSFETVTFDRLLGQYVRNSYVGDGDPPWSAGPFNAGPREQTQSAEPWDLMYGIRFNTFPRTPASIESFWYERAGSNYYGYVPEVDLQARFQAFRTETDQAARRSIMGEVFGILSRDQPVDFLSMRDSILGYQDEVVGPEETFGGNWDSNTWYFDRGSGRTVAEGWVSASPSDAQTLYFPEINDAESAARVGLTLDGAYAVDENNEVQPLWMDIEDTGDGTVYVCELRDNLRWGGDYGRMTAEDWVFQIEEVHLGSDLWDQDTPPSTQTGDWSQVENVERTGELEFQLELSTTNLDFPLAPVLWGAYCAPKALYEAYAPDAEALRRSDEIQQLQYTGNLGPYTFERWERSAEFVATRNEDYYMRAHADEMGEAWAEAPYFERNAIRVIVEQSSRLQALEQGEIAGESIPPSRYTDFVENEAITVYQVPQPALSILAYNQRRNGWDQLRTREVRQALSMAIDKRTVTEQIYRGLAEWTHTFQPRWSVWYDDSEVTPFGVDDSYDKARARALLAEHTSDDYGYEG